VCAHIWPQLSPECRDLLSRIFHIKEADRITVQQIMQHPWCVLGASCAAGCGCTKHTLLRQNCGQKERSRCCVVRAWSDVRDNVDYVVGVASAEDTSRAYCAEPSRYTAPLSQRLAEADARMLAQQSRIDTRLSAAIVDEVGILAAPAIMSVCWASFSRLIMTFALHRYTFIIVCSLRSRCKVRLKINVRRHPES